VRDEMAQDISLTLPFKTLVNVRKFVCSSMGKLVFREFG